MASDYFFNNLWGPIIRAGSSRVRPLQAPIRFAANCPDDPKIWLEPLFPPFDTTKKQHKMERLWPSGR